MNSRRRGIVQPVRPRSRRQIESQAARLVQLYWPGLLDSPGAFPMADVFEFDLRSSGLETAVVDDLPPLVEAVTVPAGLRFSAGRVPLYNPSKTIVALSSPVYDALIDGDGRARFTAGHELYHAFAHVRQVENALVDGNPPVLTRAGSIPVYRDPEWQADVFAASVLMPRPTVRLWVAQHGPDNLDRFCRTFGVSRMAAKIRVDEILREGSWRGRAG